MFFLFFKIYLFMAVTGLHCCAGYFLAVVCRLLAAVVSLVEHRPRGMQASVVAAHRL